MPAKKPLVKQKPKMEPPKPKGTPIHRLFRNPLFYILTVILVVMLFVRFTVLNSNSISSTTGINQATAQQQQSTSSIPSNQSQSQCTGQNASTVVCESVQISNQAQNLIGFVIIIVIVGFLLTVISALFKKVSPIR